MRHLQVNKIADISASSENASFPIENVLDTHPKRVWKSTSNNAIVTLDVNYGVTDVAIFGTNAETGSIVASDPNEAGWGDSDEWGYLTDGIERLVNGTFSTDLSGWTDASTGTGTATWDVGQFLKLINVDVSNRGIVYQNVAGASGKKNIYTVKNNSTSTGVASITVNSIVLGSVAPGSEGGFIAVSDGSDQCLLFASDAGTTVYVDYASEKFITDEDTWANTSITAPAVTQTQRSNSEALWLQLSTAIDRPAIIELTLDSAGGSILKAGTIDADVATLYGGKNPQYDFDQGRIDTSIEAELSNGARYYNKRDVLRQFNFVVFMTAGNASDLLEFYETYGKLARPWKVTDEDNNDWLVYGYLVDPGSSHPTVNKSYVNMAIREEL